MSPPSVCAAQSYIDIGFTFSFILFLAHILACLYYVLGKTNETLATGPEVKGWVAAHRMGEGPSVCIMASRATALRGILSTLTEMSDLR